jgi:hypothetical protein
MISRTIHKPPKKKGFKKLSIPMVLIIAAVTVIAVAAILAYLTQSTAMGTARDIEAQVTQDSWSCWINGGLGTVDSYVIASDGRGVDVVFSDAQNTGILYCQVHPTNNDTVLLCPDLTPDHNTLLWDDEIRIEYYGDPSIAPTVTGEVGFGLFFLGLTPGRTFDSQSIGMDLVPESIGGDLNVILGDGSCDT